MWAERAGLESRAVWLGTLHLLGLPTFSTSFSALWALFQESQDTLSSIDPLPWVSAQGPTSSPLAWESIQEL